jgi:cytochrome c biogenesis protein
LNVLGRVGLVAWRTLTSVRFAVLQITLLAIAGAIGAVLRQLPAFALHDPAAYAQQMAQMHQAYDPLTILGLNVGPAMVNAFEWAGFFRVFSAPWFVFLLVLLTVSILVCTIDRTPRLWRSVARVTPIQTAAFYDLRRPERARFATTDASALGELADVLRAHRFSVVENSTEPAGRVLHVYADKYRYVKLATLISHLGLILFLAGGAITAGLGFETVVFLGEGQTAPVQAVGTPGNLLVKNFHFEAPTRPDGSFADFRTDLAVYRDGQQLARKVIRVNDPLEVDGYVFHQNTFGPAEELEIRDRSGNLLWSGPVLLADELDGRPQGFLTIPGADIGLLLVLARNTDGAPLLAVTGLRASGTGDQFETLFIRGFGLGASSTPDVTAGYAITWKAASAYTGMVIKRDPGAGLIWIAYGGLMIGLVLTFYFPRRRVWARFDGQYLSVALVGDRYVNAEREFERLLDELAVRLRNRPERRMQPASGDRPV